MPADSKSILQPLEFKRPRMSSVITADKHDALLATLLDEAYRIEKLSQFFGNIKNIQTVSTLGAVTQGR